jgi:hypothetical protein
MSAQVRLHSEEAQELAALFLNISFEEMEENEDIVEEKLAEEYDISLETFEKISEFLLNKVDLAISPLTNKALIGFGDGSQWFAKMDFDSKFMGNLIQWLSENNPPKAGKGFIKEITSGGELEFIITIEKPEKGSKESFYEVLKKEAKQLKEQKEKLCLALSNVLNHSEGTPVVDALSLLKEMNYPL